MDPKKFLKTKEIVIDDDKFIISKIPAVQAQEIYRLIMKESQDDGDIAMTYLTTETMLQLVAYSAAVDGEDWVSLDDVDKINFYCKEILTLVRLEAAMIRYNFNFLFDGSLQKVLEVLRDSNPDT